MARGSTRVRGGGFAADGLPPGRFVDVRSVDGVRLHTEVFGPEDGYPVVLAHGITCALRVWAHQISELARHHRVIAFERGLAQKRPALFRAVHQSDAIMREDQCKIGFHGYCARLGAVRSNSSHLRKGDSIF